MGGTPPASTIEENPWPPQTPSPPPCLVSASLTLKNAEGGFIAESAVIVREDGTPVAVVGFDGRAFIEHLAEGRNRFTVQLPESGGECRFDMDYQAGQYKDSLPDLGEMICLQPTQ